MNSFKRGASVSQLRSLLQEWDSGSKSVRRRILQDFITQNYRKTGPDLKSEFSEAASLFFTRVTAWLRLTYMLGTCLNEQLQVLKIFLSASCGNLVLDFKILGLGLGGRGLGLAFMGLDYISHLIECHHILEHKFLIEFEEVGGVLTIIETLSVKQVRETDKAEALRVLTCVASAGRHHKELICECYGVRATTECLARSRSEETLECARHLLLVLAEGNPKFQSQVYHGLIALLGSYSSKAQHIAAQTLRVVQPIVKTAKPNMVEPVLNLLKSLHLEVQYEALELIQLLMVYEVRNALLEGLVRLLRPSIDEESRHKYEILTVSEWPMQAEKVHSSQKKLHVTFLTILLRDDSVEKIVSPLPVFIQQASAAKCIGIVAQTSTQLAVQLLRMPVIGNLLFAMGNTDYADTQRQAAITLEMFCLTYPDVASQVREAMGEILYTRFMTDAESLYMKTSSVDAEILVYNKLNVVNRRSDSAKPSLLNVSNSSK